MSPATGSAHPQARRCRSPRRRAAGRPSSLPPPVWLGTVPDVVGQPQQSAQADILAAGYSIGAVGGQNHATIPNGTVLSQIPTGGSQAQSGSPVSIVVSLGPFPDDVDQDGDGFTPRMG